MTIDTGYRFDRVSVVICAFTEDRWSDLVFAVESVAAQRYAAFETIVVIDHCPSLCKRAAEAFPWVTVTENPGAQGLADARNQGIRVATGDIVAFIDDDAWAEVDWLEHLVRPYRFASIIGVGGFVRSNWLQARPRWFPAEFDWVVGCSYVGLPTKTSTVRNFIGANMSFRRSTLEALGGFDAALGRSGTNTAGCEETELCIRARVEAPETALVYEPRSRVSHRVPSARGTWTYFVKRCYGEGHSKAMVATLAGQTAALEAERTYLRRTVPMGIARSIRSACVGDVHGLARAGALVAGVVVTACGYARGSWPRRRPLSASPIKTAGTAPVAPAVSDAATILTSEPMFSVGAESVAR